MNHPSAINSRQATSLNDKRDRLLSVLESYGRVAVAFSGGVDSTVVAKAAVIACGENALAVTANSPSLASGELELAAQIALQIGIRHVVLKTEEFQSADYTANPSNRCYFCKTELYDQIDQRRESLQIDVIVNGANVDDQGDHRPGMVAAAEHFVRSPLVEAGCGKSDVRALAKHWELPNWDKPAAPCLSSRIAYGTEVTPERVARIDRAEAYIRSRLGIRVLRVRLEVGELARIEVPLDQISILLEDALREDITRELLRFGFRAVTVDPKGFRSGSLNERLASDELVSLSLETR